MLALLCLGALGGPVTAAHASVLPPTVDISTAASIPQDSVTSVVVTITNPNATQNLSGVGLTVSLPAGLEVQHDDGGDCGGTTTAVVPSSTVDLSGGAVSAAAGSCSFAFNIKGTSAGTKVMTTDAITSTEGGDGSPAMATIVVVGPPSLATSFGSPSIAVNGTTTLSYTLTNPNAAALTNVAFSDALPSGLAITSLSNGLTGSCVGNGTIIATAGSSTVSLSGATLAANGSCTFSVTVTASAAGTLTNTTSTVTSSGGNGAPATASLLVVQAPTLNTSFGVASITVGATTSATFTILNPNSGSALSGVGVSDSLPAGLVVATPNGVTGTCVGNGTITAVAGSSTISLSGAALAASASCSFSITVKGATLGTKSNTTGPITSTQTGAGATANASLGVIGPPTISSSFSDPSIAQGATTTLSLTITNPAANPASLSGVGISDSLPAGLVVATPNGVTGSCVGNGTITATAGSSTISLSGATLSSGQSCTLSANVLATAVGVKSNVTGNVTSTEGGNGLTASASIEVARPPTISAPFAPSSIGVGGTTTLSYTVTNPAANGVALTGVGFTDALPSGLTIATNGLSGSCGGGSITATDGSSTVSLTGATLAVHGSCTFSVAVTASALGTLTNTTSTVTSSNGGTGTTASASLVVIQGPTLTTAFGAGSVVAGNSTPATFTIHNPNPSLALTGVGVSDSLPAGLVVATPNGQSSSCAGGAITATAGSSSISLSGANLAATASCSFTINVTGTTPGTKSNTTGPIMSTQSGPGPTANDSLTVIGPPTIVTSFGAVWVVQGATTSLSFTITNPAANPGDVHGVGFDDPLPAGLAVASPNGLTGSCGGGTIDATAGSSDVDLSGATLSPGATCSFSITVLATGAGPQDNVTGHITSSETGSGAAASATLDVPQPPVIQAAFADASIPLSGLTSLSFTLTNPNPIPLTGVAFSDTLPVGLVLVTLKAQSSACGGSITVSAGSVALAAATVPALGSCTFSVLVSGATLGKKDNVTSSISSTEGGTGAPAASRLIVAAAPPPRPPASTATPPPTEKTTKARAKLTCVVPRLTGRTLVQAKKLLTHAHCRLGKVTRKRVHAAKVGRITHQTPKAGSKHAAGAHVGVTLAK